MKKKLVIFLFPILLLFSCEYNHPTIPYRSVDFTIYPDDPTYALSLNHVGGSMTFTGGVNGIIIYRVSGDLFAAYDRACPYDWETCPLFLKMDQSGLLVECPCCGSLFNILDGVKITNTGPAEHPLRYYKTRYDGWKLRVYN